MVVTLSKDELKQLFVITGALALLLSVLFALVRCLVFHAEIASAIVQSTMTAVPLAALVMALVVRRNWTWSWLARLAGRPTVHGVWWGHLEASYQGKKLDPIQIGFVVKQTYVSLSIQSFTGAISADSTIEVFEKNEKNDDVRLKYVYQMNRQANAEHKLTTGYGDLRLQDGGNVLSGFYWTNSPTEGRIVLKLVQRKCDDVNCFESAKRAFERQSRLANAIK